jgi:hypothetical protein
LFSFLLFDTFLTVKGLSPNGELIPPPKSKPTSIPFLFHLIVLGSPRFTFLNFISSNSNKRNNRYFQILTACILFFIVIVIIIVIVSGLPKAEIFGRSRSFLLFGLRLWLPKFYSKYSAFCFVLKMGHYPFFSSLKADRLKGC